MRKTSDFPNLNPKRPDGIRPNGRPYKVMIVEDKEFHRKQIIQILESEKYEIIATASDGEEALKQFDKYAYDIDIITTDLDMPNLDGYAFLYHLNQKNSDVTIVFISDDTSKGVIQDLIKMGAADFILKPIQRARILDRIKRVLLKKEEAVR